MTIDPFSRDISLIRGDTDSLTLRCPASPFSAGTVLRLTVRRSPTGPILLQKTVEAFGEDGEAVFSFGEETEALAFGRYCYDIEIRYPDGTVLTPVRAALEILWEVTY